MITKGLANYLFYGGVALAGAGGLTGAVIYDRARQDQPVAAVGAPPAQVAQPPAAAPQPSAPAQETAAPAPAQEAAAPAPAQETAAPAPAQEAAVPAPAQETAAPAPEAGKPAEAAAVSEPAVATQQEAQPAATTEALAPGSPQGGEAQPAAETKTEIAALPPAQKPEIEAQPQQPEATAEPQQPDPSAAGTPSATPPAFDVVRVEPDGSVLIAGRAEPGARVEIISKDTTIARSECGANGDFVAIPDDRLAPGEHEISIRATLADGRTVDSVETAVVSIPENETGEVLAVIEQPGEASRIVAAPKGGVDAAAANPPEKAEPVIQKPGDQGAASPQPVDTTAPESATAQPAPEAEVAAAPAVTETPAAQPAPEAEIAAAPAAQPAPEAQVAEQPVPETQVAAAPAAPEQPVVSMAPPGAFVFIEAVEIEGERLFIAGGADPGLKIWLYANEVFLGQVNSDAKGRFLLQTEQELPVGDYLIRADVIKGADGAVIARAAVPFRRTPGERIAAIAPLPANGDLLRNPPTIPQPADKPVAGVEAEKPVANVEVEKPAAEAPALAQASERKEPSPAMAAEPAQTAAAPQEQAPVAKPVDVAAAPAEPAPKVDLPPGFVAPALVPVDGSVIIRRGDTLWQISRRTYGRGIRYTTIYLANTSQIRNPHMIFPGQVFRLPPNFGEEATAKQ